MKFYQIVALLFIGLLSACGQQSDFGFAKESTEGGAEDYTYTWTEQVTDQNGNSITVQNEEQSQTPTNIAPTRKIIRSADYRIQVKNVAESSTRVEDLAKSFKGYIGGQNLTTNSYQINNRITIRIPNEHFDVVMAEIGKMALFTNQKAIHSTDVTEEFFDIQTRLKTKKEVRDRYIEVLQKKAKTVEEIVMAEEKIRVIQEEIESKEGRLRFLADNVNLSTINLDIYEKVPYQKIPDEYEKSFFEEVKDQLSFGWNLIVNILLGLLGIWPFLILGIIIWWLRRKLLPRFFKSK